MNGGASDVIYIYSYWEKNGLNSWEIFLAVTFFSGGMARSAFWFEVGVCKNEPNFPGSMLNHV